MPRPPRPAGPQQTPRNQYGRRHRRSRLPVGRAPRPRRWFRRSLAAPSSRQSRRPLRAEGSRGSRTELGRTWTGRRSRPPWPGHLLARRGDRRRQGDFIPRDVVEDAAARSRGARSLHGGKIVIAWPVALGLATSEPTFSGDRGANQRISVSHWRSRVEFAAKAPIYAAQAIRDDECCAERELDAACIYKKLQRKEVRDLDQHPDYGLQAALLP